MHLCHDFIFTTTVMIIASCPIISSNNITGSFVIVVAGFIIIQVKSDINHAANVIFNT